MSRQGQTSDAARALQLAVYLPLIESSLGRKRRHPFFQAWSGGLPPCWCCDRGSRCRKTCHRATSPDPPEGWECLARSLAGRMTCLMCKRSCQAFCWLERAHLCRHIQVCATLQLLKVSPRHWLFRDPQKTIPWHKSIKPAAHSEPETLPALWTQTWRLPSLTTNRLLFIWHYLYLVLSCNQQFLSATHTHSWNDFFFYINNFLKQHFKR